MKPLQKIRQRLAEINIISWPGIILGLFSLWNSHTDHSIRPYQLSGPFLILAQIGFFGFAACAWEVKKKRNDRVIAQIVVTVVLMTLGMAEFQRQAKIVGAFRQQQALEFVAGKLPKGTVFKSEASQKLYFAIQHQKITLYWRAGHPLQEFYSYLVKSTDGEVIYIFSLTFKEGENQPVFTIYQ